MDAAKLKQCMQQPPTGCSCTIESTEDAVTIQLKAPPSNWEVFYIIALTLMLIASILGWVALCIFWGDANQLRPLYSDIMLGISVVIPWFLYLAIVDIINPSALNGFNYGYIIRRDDTLSIGAERDRFTFRENDVLDIQTIRYPSTSLALDLRGPVPKLNIMRFRTVIDFVTPLGRLRLNNAYDPKRTVWLANCLRQISGMDPQPIEEVPHKTHFPSVEASCLKRTPKRLLIVGYVAFLLLTIVFIRNEVIPGVNSYYWLSTQGILHRVDTTGTDESPQIEIEYGYSVGGKSFQSNRVGYLKDMEFGGSHLKDVLKPGSSVTVYFNPSAPSQSVLVRGIHPIVYGIIAGGYSTFIMQILLIMKPKTQAWQYLLLNTYKDPWFPPAKTPPKLLSSSCNANYTSPIVYRCMWGLFITVSLATCIYTIVLLRQTAMVLNVSYKSLDQLISVYNTMILVLAVYMLFGFFWVLVAIFLNSYARKRHNKAKGIQNTNPVQALPHA